MSVSRVICKIAPAITPTGKLRIAKATLSSLNDQATQIGLAACLFPYETYALMLKTTGAGPAPAVQTDPAVNVPGPPISPGTCQWRSERAVQRASRSVA